MALPKLTPDQLKSIDKKAAELEDRTKKAARDASQDFAPVSPVREVGEGAARDEGAGMPALGDIPSGPLSFSDLLVALQQYKDGIEDIPAEDVQALGLNHNQLVAFMKAYSEQVGDVKLARDVLAGMQEVYGDGFKEALASITPDGEIPESSALTLSPLVLLAGAGIVAIPLLAVAGADYFGTGPDNEKLLAALNLVRGNEAIKKKFPWLGSFEGPLSQDPPAGTAKATASQILNSDPRFSEKFKRAAKRVSAKKFQLLSNKGKTPALVQAEKREDDERLLKPSLDIAIQLITQG